MNNGQLTATILYGLVVLSSIINLIYKLIRLAKKRKREQMPGVRAKRNATISRFVFDRDGLGPTSYYAIMRWEENGLMHEQRSNEASKTIPTIGDTQVIEISTSNPDERRVEQEAVNCAFSVVFMVLIIGVFYAITMHALRDIDDIFASGLPERLFKAFIISLAITAILVGLLTVAAARIKKLLHGNQPVKEIKVQCRCNDVVVKQGDNIEDLIFEPVWEYKYNGKTYPMSSRRTPGIKNDSLDGPLIGDKYEIVINAYSPEKIIGVAKSPNMDLLSPAASWIFTTIFIFVMSFVFEMSSLGW